MAVVHDRSSPSSSSSFSSGGGGGGNEGQEELWLRLPAAVASALLHVLGPAVEAYHASRLGTMANRGGGVDTIVPGVALGQHQTITTGRGAESVPQGLIALPGGSGGGSADDFIRSGGGGDDDGVGLYERVYLQCVIEGTPALDSGAMQVSSRGCRFEGSFFTIVVGIGPGPAGGQLLHAAVQHETPQRRGMDTVLLVYLPQGAGESERAELLLEPDQAARLVRELTPWVGTFAELAARAHETAELRQTAARAHARVLELLGRPQNGSGGGGRSGGSEARLCAAQTHGAARRFGHGSALLSMELLRIGRVVEEWRHLEPPTKCSVGSQYRLESQQEADFQELGELMGRVSRLETVYACAGARRMMVWGMLSHRPTTAGERIHTSTNWIPYLYCLEDALLSWYQPWEARATGSLRVCNVLSVAQATSAPKTALERIATLGLSDLTTPSSSSNGSSSNGGNGLTHGLTIRYVTRWFEESAVESSSSLRLRLREQPAERYASGGGSGNHSGARLDQHHPGVAGGGGGALTELEELTAATDAFFHRAAREEAGASLLEEEAFDLAQRHLSMAEALRESAVAYKDAQQWARVRGAARNALRLHPEDTAWANGMDDGAASGLLAEAETALARFTGGGGGGGGGANSGGSGGAGGLAGVIAAGMSSSGKMQVEERTVQAPDAHSYEIWRSALTPLAEEVFALQRCSALVIGGDSGGDRGQQQPPLIGGGVTTYCRLFPSVLVFHREVGQQQLQQQAKSSSGHPLPAFGQPSGVIALHRVVADSVRMLRGGQETMPHPAIQLNSGDMALTFLARLPLDWEAREASTSPSNRAAGGGFSAPPPHTSWGGLSADSSENKNKNKKNKMTAGGARSAADGVGDSDDEEEEDQEGVAGEDVEVQLYLISSDTHSVQEWAALLNYQLSKCESESGSTAREAVSLCRTASSELLNLGPPSLPAGGIDCASTTTGAAVAGRVWSSTDLSDMSPTPASMAAAASAVAAGAPPLSLPPPLSPTPDVVGSSSSVSASASAGAGATAGRRGSIVNAPPPAASTVLGMACQVKPDRHTARENMRARA
eukprot:COSAG05_NODE_791_length_7316_cov_149.311071_4_plen_1066_part_00